MTLSGSNLFSLFFPLIFNPFEQSFVSSAAASILVWKDSFDWVGLGFVMWGWVGQYCSAGEYRCDDNGMYSVAPKLSSIQPTPTHAYIYSLTNHGLQTFTFFCFCACLDQFKSRQNNLTCIPTLRTRKKEKTLPKALRTQALTALTKNFGLVGLVRWVWLGRFGLVGLVW